MASGHSGQFEIELDVHRMKSSNSATSLKTNLSKSTGQRGVNRCFTSEIGMNIADDYQRYKNKTKGRKCRKKPKKRRLSKTALAHEVESSQSRLNERRLVSDSDRPGAPPSAVGLDGFHTHNNEHDTSIAPKFSRFDDNSSSRPQSSLLPDSLSNVFASTCTVDSNDRAESQGLPCKWFCASSDGRPQRPTVLCDRCEKRKIKNKARYKQSRRARKKAKARCLSVPYQGVEFEPPSLKRVQSNSNYPAASDERTRSFHQRSAVVTHRPLYGAQRNVALSPVAEQASMDPSIPAANAKQFPMSYNLNQEENDQMSDVEPVISPLTSLPFQTDGWSRMRWPSDVTFVPSHFSGFSSRSSSYRSSSSTASLSTSRLCTSAVEFFPDRPKMSQQCQTDVVATRSTETQTEIMSAVEFADRIRCNCCGSRNVIPSSVEYGCGADSDGYSVVNSVASCDL